MDIQGASLSADPPGNAGPDGDPGARGIAGATVSLGALRHSFGELDVLAGIDLELQAGGIIGIVGPSGCGKSTLLELIAGLREPAAGSISVAGATTPDGRLGNCAYMPQRDQLLPWLRALDNAALAPHLNGYSRRAARELARPLFRRLGLGEFEDAQPRQLSGGMRQRVAFARTLLSGKPVLLLDEPFASLDAITRADLQEWLATALEIEPRTVVLVSHDVEEALYLSDRILVLSSRPAEIVAELDAPAPRARPRAETVSDPDFGRARQRALSALSGTGQNGGSP